MQYYYFHALYVVTFVTEGWVKTKFSTFNFVTWPALSGIVEVGHTIDKFIIW